MALDATASGVFPIAPTPFHPDGRLDEASIDTLIAGYLKAGSTGVTVLGIMGEAPKLELEESIVIRRPRVTPPRPGRSIAWLADRRRDPEPINSPCRQAIRRRVFVRIP
jgi:hypothetical protein